MHNAHARNTVRYYLLVIFLLAFLFFSNDFGLVDVQKTAIVMAAGIDREGEDFILTSQIAIPQSSKQGKATEAVQLVSRGKTVAEAFEEINAKTGWYPKLVFIKLVVLGEKAAKENVFDALDFFLRDEYLTDDCQLAVCEGLAKDMLNISPLVDPSSGVAISKVLSPHAERVGTVLPMNLKDFAIDYFGDSRSGLLPVLKKEEQQEKIGSEQGGAGGQSGGGSSQGSGESSGGQGSAGGASGGESGEAGGSGGQEKSGEAPPEKPVFSAKRTALFYRGKWVDTLTEEETFAVQAATGKLQLANYSVAVDGGSCSLIIKRNLPSLRLQVGKDGRGQLDIQIVLVAGTADFSKSQDLESTKDAGSIPDGVFFAASKALSATLTTAFEKAKRADCDIFGLQERLIKYKSRKLGQFQESLLDNTSLSVRVSFEKLR